MRFSVVAKVLGLLTFLFAGEVCAQVNPPPIRVRRAYTDSISSAVAASDVIFLDHIKPSTAYGFSLGTSALPWDSVHVRRIFFPSGGLLNFGAGNYIITHSNDLLTFSDKVSIYDTLWLGNLDSYDYFLSSKQDSTGQVNSEWNKVLTIGIEPDTSSDMMIRQRFESHYRPRSDTSIYNTEYYLEAGGVLPYWRRYFEFFRNKSSGLMEMKLSHGRGTPVSTLGAVTDSLQSFFYGLTTGEQQFWVKGKPWLVIVPDQPIAGEQTPTFYSGLHTQAHSTYSTSNNAITVLSSAQTSVFNIDTTGLTTIYNNILASAGSTYDLASIGTPMDTIFTQDLSASGVSSLAQFRLGTPTAYVGRIVDGVSYITFDSYNGTNFTGRSIYIRGNTVEVHTGSGPTKRFDIDATGAATIANTLTVNTAGGNISWGVYTPTRSAEANLDANVTMTEAQYMRVGNTVTVSGRFTANPTTTLTTTSFEITLPIASNIGAVEDAAGTAFCGTVAGQGAALTGSVANNTAVITWVAGDITNQTWSYHFSYQII